MRQVAFSDFEWEILAKAVETGWGGEVPVGIHDLEWRVWKPFLIDFKSPPLSAGGLKPTLRVDSACAAQ